MVRALIPSRAPTAQFSLAAAMAVAVALAAVSHDALAQGGNKTDDATLIRAREQYDRARALGQKGKFEEARKILEETWKLKKHWEVGAYLGRAELKTGRYRSAAEHSAYALRLISPDADPAERRQLEQQYAEARAQITTVQLRGVEPNAVVVVDGHEREEVFAEDPLFLHPGPHQIEVREPGRPPRRRTTTAEVGTATELDMSTDMIERIGSAAIQEPPPAAPPQTSPITMNSYPYPERSASWRPRTWVAVAEGVASGVALGVGVGFLLKARSLDSDARDTMTGLRTQSAIPCATPSPECADVSRMYADRDRAADWAKVGIITGGVLGIATVTTLLLWPSRKTTWSATPQRAARNYWISPGTEGSAGLTVGGMF